MDSDYILGPQIVKVSFEVDAVFNGLESLRLLTEISRLSGLGDWVNETSERLSPEMLEQNRLVFDTFFPVIYGKAGVGYDHADLGAFANALAAKDAVQIRDLLLQDAVEMPRRHPDWWGEFEIPAVEELLNDREVFTRHIRKLTDCSDESVLPEQAYDLIQNPAELQALIVGHIRMMWNDWLKPEWDRATPMVQESVNAFRQMSYVNMTAYEAIRAVTGRDLRGTMDEKLAHIDHILFVPNAHIGPYVAKFPDDNVMRLIFGARLPRGVHAPSSELSRSELLVRLNALADGVRLRILELLTKHDELCAQDIIEELGLSQSSVSRHLSQLSATGYITERRREVSKCYSLNTDRVVDTVRAMTNFLSVNKARFMR